MKKQKFEQFWTANQKVKLKNAIDSEVKKKSKEHEGNATQGR